jgi:hypothetical protein
MNDEFNNNVTDSQFEVDNLKAGEIQHDSNKNHPLHRASLELCPKKWSITEDLTSKQHSLNVELDDADYLNHDPLEGHLINLDELTCDDIIDKEYESKFEK